MTARSLAYRGRREAAQRQIAAGQQLACEVAAAAPTWYVYFSPWQFVLVAMPMGPCPAPLILTNSNPVTLLEQIRKAEEEWREPADAFQGGQDVAAGSGTGPITVYNAASGAWDVVDAHAL